MKYVIFILLTIPILFLLCCCRGRMAVDSHEVEYTISPLLYEVADIDIIATIVDSVVTVTPEATGISLLSHIKKIVVTPGGEFIVMDKNGVYHFAKNGDFIRKYGSKGRARNEYLELTDIAIDSKSGDLSILDAMNKILIFDTTNGAFKKSVTMDWGKEKYGLDGIIPKSDGGRYIFSANTAYMESDNDYYSLHEFDAEGRKVAKYLSGKEFIIGLGATSYGYDNKHLIRPMDSSNIVHQVTDDEIKPFLHIDFGDRNAPAGVIYNKAGVQDLAAYFSSDYYKNPCYFQQTGDQISFVYAGPDYESAGVIFFKETGRGVRYYAPDKRTIPLIFIGSDGEFMYAMFDKFSDEGLSQRADPLTRYIVTKVGFADIEQNPMIVGIKFKK